MTLLQALHNNDVSLLELSVNTALDPLELSRLEQEIVIARMKKLAKDSSISFPNALKLVHKSYEEQEWERQNDHGDFARPQPSNKKAWEQYEKFIQLSVQLLSKHRGPKGDWRTDRFATIPTSDRSSMGSMAAAKIGEQWDVIWDNPNKSNLILEFLDDQSIFKRNMNVQITFESLIQHIVEECETLGLIVTEGQSTDTTCMLHIYDKNGSAIENCTLQQTKSG